MCCLLTLHVASFWVLLAAVCHCKRDVVSSRTIESVVMSSGFATHRKSKSRSTLSGEKKLSVSSAITLELGSLDQPCDANASDDAMIENRSDNAEVETTQDVSLRQHTTTAESFVAYNIEQLRRDAHSAHLTGATLAHKEYSDTFSTTVFVLLMFVPLCFSAGYFYALQSRRLDDDVSSSESSEDEGNMTDIETNSKNPLRPRKPQGTAKDRGLLAWLPATSANALVSTGSAPPDVRILEPAWTTLELKEILTTYGIPTQDWTDSALTDLGRELGKCKARLFRKGETLFRAVDMVIVIVEHKEEGTVIQEMSHPPYRRAFATIPERTPKSRMNINENITDCAKRCLQEKLQAPNGLVKDLQIEVLSITETVESFDHMPGLSSVVRSYVVRTDVSTKDRQDLEKIGAPRGRLEIEGYRYTWMKTRVVTNLKKYTKRRSSRKKQRLQKVVMDSSAVPVLAWSESEVLEHCAEAGISREEAEKRWGMDLGSILEQLRGGQLSLARSTSDHGLFCIEDLVTLYALSKDEMVLVTRPDSGKGKKALPSTRKFANESAWAASFRMSFLKLGILSPKFHITEVTSSPIKCYEEAPLGGRIKREFIVQAHLDENVPPTVQGLDSEDEEDPSYVAEMGTSLDTTFAGLVP